MVPTRFDVVWIHEKAKKILVIGKGSLERKKRGQLGAASFIFATKKHMKVKRYSKRGKEIDVSL